MAKEPPKSKSTDKTELIVPINSDLKHKMDSDEDSDATLDIEDFDSDEDLKENSRDLKENGYRATDESTGEEDSCNPVGHRRSTRLAEAAKRSKQADKDALLTESTMKKKSRRNTTESKQNKAKSPCAKRKLDFKHSKY